jgi:uncharacterized membrane protein YdcZ (DUF606 family)
VVGIVIFNVVDPEAAAHLNEQILLKSKQMMEGFGMTQEVIATALDEASKKDNFSIGSQLQSYVFSLALYTIIGLIVAGIFSALSKNTQTKNKVEVSENIKSKKPIKLQGGVIGVVVLFLAILIQGLIGIEDVGYIPAILGALASFVYISVMNKS